jgi:hypothetical protein
MNIRSIPKLCTLWHVTHDKGSEGCQWWRGGGGGGEIYWIQLSYVTKYAIVELIPSTEVTFRSPMVHWIVFLKVGHDKRSLYAELMRSCQQLWSLFYLSITITDSFSFPTLSLLTGHWDRREMAKDACLTRAARAVVPMVGRSVVVVVLRSDCVASLVAVTRDSSFRKSHIP